MKGSMTVEAVLVISFLLIIILWIMKATIFLYQETVELTRKEWLHLEETVELFRQFFLQKELL